MILRPWDLGCVIDLILGRLLNFAIRNRWLAPLLTLRLVSLIFGMTFGNSRGCTVPRLQNVTMCCRNTLSTLRLLGYLPRLGKCSFTLVTCMGLVGSTDGGGLKTDTSLPRLLKCSMALLLIGALGIKSPFNFWNPVMFKFRNPIKFGMVRPAPKTCVPLRL